MSSGVLIDEEIGVGDKGSGHISKHTTFSDVGPFTKSVIVENFLYESNHQSLKIKYNYTAQVGMRNRT